MSPPVSLGPTSTGITGTQGPTCLSVHERLIEPCQKVARQEFRVEGREQRVVQERGDPELSLRIPELASVHAASSQRDWSLQRVRAGVQKSAAR